MVGEYAVSWEPRSGELAVEGTFTAGAGPSFALDVGADGFVRAVEASADGKAWSAVTRRGRTFTAAPCAEGPCRLRYRFALREAGKKIDEVDTASLEGEVVEAPPSTWLLAPFETSRGARVRFRVTCPEGSHFATGVFPSREAEGAWDATLDDLSTSPYSVFGPLRTRSLDVKGGKLEIAIGPGRLAVTDEQLLTWIEGSARAITTYFGRFPMRHALLVLIPGGGRWVGGGKTLSGGGGTVFMRIGENAPWEAYREDWVLVHEMAHLVFPSVPRGQDWAEEGFATYVEPFARVRAGLLREEDAWLGLADGLPNGLPRAGDRGLDHTPTWGRTYWGGALFYLLADVEMRKASKGRAGLEDAMRGVLDAGGNNASRWKLADVFASGDRAIGVTALTDQHAKMGASPYPVDLTALFASLGVEVSPKGVRFDPKAPLADVRRAITHGK